MAELPQPLPPEALRWRCDLGEPLPADGSPPANEKFIGQQRAQRALAFGLEVRSPEFNIFLSGPPGTGRYTMCRSICERIAAERAIPSSLAFVHDFDDPERPLWLKFPPGLGRSFRDDVDSLVVELRDAIPKAFEDEAHEAERKQIIESIQARQQELLSQLEEKAKEAGFAVRPGQGGFALIPLINGEPATEETFEKLAPEERERIAQSRNAFNEHVGEFVKQTRALEKELRGRIRNLEKDIALTAVRGPIDDLREKYRDFQKVREFLDKVQEHILGNLQHFRPEEENQPQMPFLAMRRGQEEDPFKIYTVNLAVDTSDMDGAPVVFESNPNFSNLFGRVERRAVFGAYTTDFTMIRAGSMIRANGGFLLLNALDALINPGVWPALKRAIRTRCVRIEDLGETYGWTQGGIKPDPVPVDVKVILMGSPTLYYLLLHHDEDFQKLFKVKADFSSAIDRTPESLRDYREFIEFHRNKSDLMPFRDDAVAALLEESARAVAHQRKLSARFGEVHETIIEADHWAREEGVSEVGREQILRAVREKRRRSDLIDERLRELILEGTLFIDVQGAVVGQVNGLAVMDLGDYVFGKPSRITAQTFIGERGVVNVERESKLSGSIHDKGMLILQGYLGGLYARRRPLALSASITFEQNYSGVDGDSASSTELYAILSSLSGLPVKQGLAVTGSINQRGEIQPIGGVNEKIEGFFEICKEKGGLTGDQGVLIPEPNVKNLMLRDEVIEAVRAGKFRIYPVRDADQGISLLTGVPAGERDPGTGDFPPESVHGRAEARLRQMYDDISRFRRGDGKDKKDEDEEAGKKDEPGGQPPSPPPPPGPPPRRGG
ncbi:MAG: AAA family ATPase [Candidatus Tectomicrobia bacterium]|uniref:endopeptidase La n=1 Tax=Tectimicrobiota bacterium TaxID=2528274 RepID=A0A932HZH4_UNCTE|nr:AAA family ATPase [Candidatus Tectomicrobia bacterium]